MFMKEFGQDYNSILSMPFYEAQLILEYANEQAKEQNEGQQQQQAQMEGMMKQPNIPEMKMPDIKMPSMSNF